MAVATLAASGAADAQAGPIGSLTPVASAAGARDLQPNPVAVRPLYVEPHSAVRARERSWQGSRPDDAALLARIADQPQGLWLGEWRRDVRGTVAARVRAGLRTGATPILVAYNIPHRDCGQHSSGGASDGRAYRAWIAQMARGIGTSPAIVILEPDALAGMGCLQRGLRTERSALIREAVATLSALPQTAVYIDAGNPGWMPARRIAKRLRDAGVARARGFSVNVSGFATTAAVPGVRSRGVGADGRRPLRGGHEPQRARRAALGRVVQPARPGPRAVADRRHRRAARRRFPVGEAAGRVGRHVQRRAARRDLLAGVRAGPREARARGLTQPSNPAREGR